MSMNDDHYIPDQYNAHVDTRDFEVELKGLAGNLSGSALDTADLYPTIHQKVADRLSAPLEEPSDDTLVCRYLSTTKFLWFVESLVFTSVVPERSKTRRNALSPATTTSVFKASSWDEAMVPLAWDDYAERMRARSACLQLD